MALATLSGTASHIKGSVVIHGSNANIAQESSTHFRLGNRQVLMKSSIQLAEGDQVTVAGEDKAEFHALALRNETTNLIYQLNTNVGVIGAWLIIIVSVPMIPILVGFITMAVGIYFLRANKRIASAVRMLGGKA